MGCTPSAHQTQSTNIQSYGNGADGSCDYNKNSSNSNFSGKTGCSWRKKADKKKDSILSFITKDALENLHNADSGYGALGLINQKSSKILLGFMKNDPFSDNLVQAAEKLGFECTLCHCSDTIIDVYTQTGHEIVVLDNRNIKSLDAVAICRKIRRSKWCRKSVLVAIVRKSYLEDSYCLPLLNVGFNRCLTETFNVGVLMNELIEIEHSDVKPRLSMASSNTLYTALSKCKDLVQVTDEAFNVLFVNKATETFLGFRNEDLRGKQISEIHQSLDCQNQMTHLLSRGKEWEGVVTCVRKGGDPVSLLCRVVGSSNNYYRNVTNYIFIEEPLNEAGIIPIKDQPPRGSLHSIRKGSYDVKSLASESGQSLRRQSLAKLNSLPIEAPFTKIITLLHSAHEQSSGPVQQQLEKVLDILRSTELYSPQLKENRIRTEDPITADLISALLSQGNIASSATRRSSNDSANLKSSATSRPSLPSINAPGQLSSVLEQSLDWEFDIFRLEELSNQRPLVWLGMNLLCHFNVQSTLGCDEKTLMNWLTVVEMHYHSTNSYHNSTHAADVMQASGCYLKKEKLNALLDPLDIACVLIAACCHDIDHPGKSSIFLSNSDHDLAILYNDQSVLESHHAAMTFKLTLADDRVNIFKGLERETYNVARQSIIDMILATEMTRHFEHLAKFVNVFTKLEPSENDTGSDSDFTDSVNFQTQENISLAKRMLIKCADVSNPTRPLKQCVEWAKRIAEEYFNQTDEEKANGLPVVMPMFDRSTCSIPKSQIGFVDFIINDMMEAWDSFIELPEMLYYLRSNYQYWKEKEEQGITSLNEIYLHNNRIDLLKEMDESKVD